MGTIFTSQESGLTIGSSGESQHDCSEQLSVTQRWPVYVSLWARGGGRGSSTGSVTALAAGFCLNWM